MVYGSKFFIVEKSSFEPEKDTGLKYASVIAMFDMSKISGGRISKLIRSSENTEYYFYDIGGDVKIIEDGNGARLREIDLEALIEVVINEMEYQGYRRFKPFLALLQGFLGKEKWKDVAVLHYGY